MSFIVKGIITEISPIRTTRQKGIAIQQLTVWQGAGEEEVSPCFFGEKINLLQGLKVSHSVEIEFKIKKSKGIHNLIAQSIKVL